MLALRVPREASSQEISVGIVFVCNFTNTLPVLDKQLQVAEFKNICGI